MTWMAQKDQLPVRLIYLSSGVLLVCWMFCRFTSSTSLELTCMVSYVFKSLRPLDFIGPLTCLEDGWRFIWFHSNAWLIYSLAAQCMLALCGPVRMLGGGGGETFLCPGGILWGEFCLFKGGREGDNTRTAGKTIGNLIPWTLPSYSIPVLAPSPIKRPPPRQWKNGLMPLTSRTSQGSCTIWSIQLQK